MRVALAQINVKLGDFEGNVKKISAYIRDAQKYGADIVAFPEMAVCGYPPEDLLYKKHFIDDNLHSLNVLAKTTKDTAAVVGFVYRDSKKDLYNSAAVLFNGKIAGLYHKRKLPNYGVFDEKRYFKEGSKCKNFLFGQVPFAVNICEDIWVKDSPVVGQAGNKARLFINISSSPYDINKHEERTAILKRMAVKYKSVFCYVNLVGGQDELVFDGGSSIVDRNGKIIAQGKYFEEDLVVADIDVKSRIDCTDKQRFWIVGRKDFEAKKGCPLPSRTVRSYSVNERIYRALVLGTRDYVTKNGFKKVVVGLSGGIDSSLVAALAVEAVGKENVIGVTMPSEFSSRETRADAARLATNLDIKFIEIPITDAFNIYKKSLSKEFHGVKPDTAEENIQARIRGNFLMALSNKFNWLVLTTGNKSELAVGYCTLYGDMSGGFAVIKDLPKTKVYEITEMVNKDKEIIPRSVIERAPTAELRKNQKDQDSLPPYGILDKILDRYVERHESVETISKRFDKETVKKIIRLIDLNEYKRRQSPPGVKITTRAFGKDWRLPITNGYREYEQ